MKYINICFVILLALSGCSSPGFDLQKWNAQNYDNNKAFKMISPNIVEIVFVDDQNIPQYSGTGVFIKSRLNGYPAILTIRHVADQKGISGHFNVINTEGEILGNAKPVYQGFYANHVNDGVIAMAMDPNAIFDKGNLDKIEGVSIAPVISTSDMYGMVNQPFGVINGDSGAGWFDQQGRLIGITSRTMDNAVPTPVIEAAGLSYSHISDSGYFSYSRSYPNTISINAPKMNYLLLESLDTSYLTSLFPGMFLGISASDQIVYAHPFSYGFGGFVGTYSSSDKLSSNNACAQMLDDVSKNRDETDHPPVNLHAPICRSIMDDMIRANQAGEINYSK
jgi:hypothetical protein